MPSSITMKGLTLAAIIAEENNTLQHRIMTRLGNLGHGHQVISSHLIMDKTNALMENGSLMKVKSIAECSPEHSAILLTCIK